VAARIPRERRSRESAVRLATGVCLLALAAAGCGSSASPSGPSTSPAPTPDRPATITITASGVSPREVLTTIGSRVTFVNNDVIPHDIAGGPDPSRPDCHEIDAVGFLTPGQSRQTNPFERARTCEYHDHSAHSPNVAGRIIIR